MYDHLVKAAIDELTAELRTANLIAWHSTITNRIRQMPNDYRKDGQLTALVAEQQALAEDITIRLDRA